MPMAASCWGSAQAIPQLPRQGLTRLVHPIQDGLRLIASEESRLAGGFDLHWQELHLHQTVIVDDVLPHPRRLLPRDVAGSSVSTDDQYVTRYARRE